MRKGTPEYAKYREEIIKKADQDLADAYRTFTMWQLLHDWRCNISKRSREILRNEFKRRGIDK